MQQFDPSKGHSAQYIATHIARIEGKYANKPNMQHDSMWRIASHCNLFPYKELGQQLTEKQALKVRQFISDFKCNFAFENLIQKCKEANP